MRPEDKPTSPLHVRRALLPEILTEHDLAVAIDRSLSVVRRLLRNGFVPARRLGRGFLILRDDLLRAIGRRRSVDRAEEGAAAIDVADAIARISIP